LRPDCLVDGSHPDLDVVFGDVDTM